MPTLLSHFLPYNTCFTLSQQCVTAGPLTVSSVFPYYILVGLGHVTCLEETFYYTIALACQIIFKKKTCWGLGQ